MILLATDSDTVFNEKLVIELNQEFEENRNAYRYLYVEAIDGVLYTKDTRKEKLSKEITINRRIIRELLKKTTIRAEIYYPEFAELRYTDFKLDKNGLLMTIDLTKIIEKLVVCKASDLVYLMAAPRNGLYIRDRGGYYIGKENMLPLSELY